MTAAPLRIAMISYYLPSGSKIGVGHQVDQLANAMVDAGHVVDVFSDCPAVEGARYGHRHVKMRGSLRTFRFATRLRREDFSGYDVLHAHTDDYWLWKRRAKVHVRTLHGSCFEEAIHIRGVKERTRMLALGLSEILASVVADRTVVVSPGTRRWTPWVRSVVPNGVDAHAFRPDPTKRWPHPVVLFVGTWGGRKRGALLARQFTEHVRTQHPDAELWMVTRDAPANLPEGIRVLGRVSDERLRELYQQAWVFSLPSSYEGFGIPYAEAMASGLPVVATPNIGARYVSREGTDAVLAADDGLGKAISRVLGDEAERRRLSEAGLQRSRTFTLEAVVAQYEQIYRDLLRRRSG